jgi:hypothetical protein
VDHAAVLLFSADVTVKENGRRMLERAAILLASGVVFDQVKEMMNCKDLTEVNLHSYSILHLIHDRV